MHSSGIFFDSADLTEFKKWFHTHILGGATTNPVILQKEGIFDIPTHVAKMIDICGKNFPISIEIPDTDMTVKEMLELGKRYYARFPDNAVVKVPMHPSSPEKAFEVIYKLGQEGIRVNATLGLSVGQLIGAAEALRNSKAKGDNYISLFWARRDEAQVQIIDNMVEKGTERQIAQSRVPDAKASLQMTKTYLENHGLSAKIIVGSVRSIDQIDTAFSSGADIVTIPPKLIREWMYTKRGIESVDQFNEAYRSIKDKTTLI